MLRSRILEFLVVLVCCTFASSLLAWRTDFWTPNNPLFWKPYDHWAYIYMAGHPFEPFGMAPFGWRVLAPWTIGVLDSGEKGHYFQGGYWCLAFGGVMVAGISSYGIGKRLFGTRESGALLCCWFWSFYWATKAPLGLFVYLDGATCRLVALLVYLVLSRRDALFVVALALGVAFKESALFCWPLIYTLRASRSDRLIAALTRAVALVLPTLCVLILLRVSIPTRNADAAYRATLPVPVRQDSIVQLPYSYSMMWHHVGEERLRTLSPLDIWRWTSGIFGVAALLLTLAGIYFHPKMALRWAPFFLLCYLQLGFATNDQRLLVIAFPGVLALVGTATHSLAKRWRTPLWSFFLTDSPFGFECPHALSALA